MLICLRRIFFQEYQSSCHNSFYSNMTVDVTKRCSMSYQLTFTSLALISFLFGLALSKTTPYSTLASFGGCYLITMLSYYIMYQSWVYPIYVSPLRGIPTLPGFPLWGHTPTIVTNEIGVPFREWRQQYGDIVRYFCPFGIERSSVIDEASLKQITINNPYNYPKIAGRQKLDG